MPRTTTLSDAERFAKLKEQLAKANQKWRANNKEKVNEISKNYYERNREDPEFRKKQSEKAMRAYHKRKAREFEENTLLVIEI
jgi:hypothetical protein